MIRIGEIHADGLVAKTYLTTLGRPHLNLLPYKVVGCAFLVDYRRHSHDAFLLGNAFLLRRFAIVAHEQFGPCRTVFDSYRPGTSDRFKDGRGGKSGGSGRSRG